MCVTQAFQISASRSSIAWIIAELPLAIMIETLWVKRFLAATDRASAQSPGNVAGRPGLPR